MSDIDWARVLGPVVDQGGIGTREFEDLERAVFGESPRAIRVHPTLVHLGLDDWPFPTEPVPWYTHGRIATSLETRPGRYLQHAVGDYYVQDAASMLPLALSDVRPGESVADLCAAPGGKTTGLLERLDGHGWLMANEVVRSRIPTLRTAIARSGYLNCSVMDKRVEDLVAPFSKQFDCVLVDAPCTGQSMVARGKQSTSAFSQKQIKHNAVRQQRLLQSAAHLVRPGGRLVYSTCTYAYLENEAVVRWFLDEYEDWSAGSPVGLSPQLTNWSVPDSPGCFRLWPHRDRTAGGFAAILHRGNGGQMGAGPDLGAGQDMASEPHPENRRARKRERQVNPGTLQVCDVPEELQPFGPFAGLQFAARTARSGKRELHALPDALSQDWIPMSHSGVLVAEEQAGRWRPTHAAARNNQHLSPGRSSACRLELSVAELERFVGGESLPISPQLREKLQAFAGHGDPPTWVIASWRGRSVGLAKRTSDSLKNHFPRTLRQQVFSQA